MNARPPLVYLAARYSRNAEMRVVRDALAHLDITVTSRWIDLHPDIVGNHEESKGDEALNASPEECAPLAGHDLDDLEQADWMVNFTGLGGRRGGRHVEFGYALARGKRLFVVGPREHVFHTLPTVEHFPTWAAFAVWLGTSDWSMRRPGRDTIAMFDRAPGGQGLPVPNTSCALSAVECARVHGGHGEPGGEDR